MLFWALVIARLAKTEILFTVLYRSTSFSDMTAFNMLITEL